MKKNVQRPGRKGAVTFNVSASGCWLLGSGFSGEAITRMEKLVGGRLEICGTGPGSGNSRDWIKPAKVACYCITTSVANGTTSNSTSSVAQ